MSKIKKNDLEKIAKQILVSQGKGARRKKSGGGSLLKTLIGLILLVVLGFALALQDSDSESPHPDGIQSGSYKVERCVDGDTIVLEGNIKIRLIGADTPETKKPNWPVEPFGPEAAAFTKDTIEQAGNHVRIEFDGPKTDRYNRTLAHVYVGDVLLSEELIRRGFATAELQYRFSEKMKERFREAEYEAQKARRGIWSLSESP